MHNEFTAIIERDEDWFIAFCPEVPGANGQGHSIEECRAIAFKKKGICNSALQAASASSSGRLHSAKISCGVCSNLISACSTFADSASNVGK